MSPDLAAFSEVLEERFQAKLRQSEADFEDQAMALIVQRRTEAEQRVAQLEQTYQRKRQELQGIHQRTLREIDSEGRRRLVDFRFSRMEEALREALAEFRQGPDYGDYLIKLVDGTRALLGGIIGFRCEGLEARLLRPRYPDLILEERLLDRWGGVLVLGEGGAIVDCTFRTCWEKFRGFLVLRGY